MWWIFWPVLVTAAVSSRGTPHEQVRRACNEYRNGTPAAPCLSPVTALDDLRRMDEKAARRKLGGAGIEHLNWRQPLAEIEAGIQFAPEENLHEYRIGIVEFDDQGNAWNEHQVNAVQRALDETLRSSHTLVAVFVHGWKNDCKECNGDLTCFRETLALLSANEKLLAKQLSQGGQQVPPREVFGVYVAWRGASSTMEPAKELSFFSRKSAADRIGSSRGGELTRLLGWLNAAREIDPVRKSPLKNMISLLGHSFGADVLFGAVANALDASIGEGEVQSMSGLTAKPFGDVLVLVNPAFEASAYRRFDAYADRVWRRGEPPLMVTVQARNDWATHYAFPVGRSIATLAQSSASTEGYGAMLTALGHQSGYYTHHLVQALDTPKSVEVLKDITKSTPRAGRPEEQLEELVGTMGRKPAAEPTEPCGCDDTRASDETLRALWLSVQHALSTTPPPGILQVGSPLNGLTTDMIPCGTPNLDAPLLVVRTDPPIVDGHSGIRRPEFFDFLANLIMRTQLLRDPGLHRAVARVAPSTTTAPPQWPACR